MNEQLDELYILQVMVNENVRSFQGNILNEAVIYGLPIDKDIHMPPDVNAWLDTLFFMAPRIGRA